MDHTSFPTTNAFPEPHAQGYTTTTADGAETTATDWNPSWGWAAGAMISTLDDMHIWAPALATGKLLSPGDAGATAADAEHSRPAAAETDTGWGSSISADGSVTTAACPAMRRSRCTCPRSK